MKRELINTIIIDKSNFEYIAKTGHINGTLLIEIERVMEQYHESRMKEIKKFKGRPNPEDVNPYDLATVKKNIATRKNK